MLAHLAANRLLRYGAGLSAAYWIMAWWLPFQTINLIMSCLWLTLSAAAAVAYADDAWVGVMRPGGPTRGDILALGIFLGMLSACLNRVYSPLFRVTGDIGWLNNTGLVYMFALSCMAAALHLTAPHEMHSLPRRRMSGPLIAALVAGSTIAGFLVAWQVKS